MADRRRLAPLLHTAVALTVSTGGTAILGVVFWAVAAHLYRPQVLGRGAALIASMTFIASVSQLNMMRIFPRLLPIVGARTGRFLRRSYGAAVATSVVLASVFVVAGIGRGFLPHGAPASAVFIVSCALWCVFVIQDSAMVSLRSSGWVPIENITFALAKLALLPVFAGATFIGGVFLAWTLPVAGAVGAVSWYLARRLIPAAEAVVVQDLPFPGLRELASFAGAEYLESIVENCGSLLLPLLVVWKLGPEANAYFYTPWIVGTAFVLVLWNIAISFIVEAAADTDRRPQLIRHAVRMGAVFVLVVTAVGATVGPLALRLLGENFAAQGTTLFRLVVLALPFSGVTVLYGTFALLHRRVWPLLIRQGLNVATMIGLSLIFMPTLGITAVGVSYLAAQIALAAVFGPSTLRQYRALTRQPATTVLNAVGVT